MSLASVGEFGLIDQIRKWTNSSNHSIISIGDDAAVFSPKEGWDLVWSVDALVEGVHFDRQYVPMDSLGWKTLAANLSDLAAMGAVPQYALVSLAVPESWSVDDIESLYQGMIRCCQSFECKIVGGDTTRSRKDGYISVTVIGEVEKGRAVQRSGAGVGDTLFCTGLLGCSKAGFEILSTGASLEDKEVIKNKFLEPVPRVKEARWLVQHTLVTAMIDISDGLASEIHHLCQESDVGCFLEADYIPVQPDAAQWFASHDRSFIEESITSGEEYELLFTVRTDNPNDLIQMAQEQEIEIHKIGHMVPQNEGIQIGSSRGSRPLKNQGWNHFQ